MLIHFLGAYLSLFLYPVKQTICVVLLYPHLGAVSRAARHRTGATCVWWLTCRCCHWFAALWYRLDPHVRAERESELRSAAGDTDEQLPFMHWVDAMEQRLRCWHEVEFTNKQWPARRTRTGPDVCLFDQAASKSVVNNSGYLYRLFHSRTKSESLDSNMYVSGWLVCCHEPKYLQDPLHHVLSWLD